MNTSVQQLAAKSIYNLDEEATFAGFVRSMQLGWESNKRGQGSNQNQNRQQTNKLSTIQRGNDQAPQFQQRGEGSQGQG